MRARSVPRWRVPPRAMRPGDRALAWAAVRFSPDTTSGMDHGAAGTVDYRLARRAILAEFRRGRLSHTDVCDAHPELRRAAQEYSRPTSELCPICEAHRLVLVTYVFGPTLPAYGRCVANLKELTALAKAARRHEQPFTCYVVEVCPDCHWNHLAKVFPLTPARSE